MYKRGKSKFTYFSKRHALYQSFIISAIINCILIVGALHTDTPGIGVNWQNYLEFFLWHFCCNVILYYLLFSLNFRIIQRQAKFVNTSLIAIVGTISICLLFSPFLTRLQWFALGLEGRFPMMDFIYFNLAKDMILAIIVILVSQYIYANYRREQAIITNQRLVEENIRTRYEALKNQLDPHFLFNSLNTLNELIGIDNEKAQEYVDNLSSIFRYTLNNKNIQRLDEELRFVESFVALLKVRYGKNLIVEYNIEEQYRDFEIMPVSIQLLVENAVKHNVISNNSPLIIDISTTSHNSVVVSNRINPKSEEGINHGVGLANLTDRYMILFKKSIAISNTDGIFSVEIPLVEKQ